MRDKMKELDEQIALLQKEKEKELLRIEVEKLKKTVIEETTIIKRVVEKWEPHQPTCPLISYNLDETCPTTTTIRKIYEDWLKINK